MRVLVSAYACEPHKGSEAAIGWNWSKQIAKVAEVWVVTRANNKAIIEKEMLTTPEPDLHFIYVDLPEWLLFWKRKERGIHLYYCIWQLVAFLKIMKLHRKMKFSINHHITFVNNWLPSFLAFLPGRFVWGPIGSNMSIPGGFLPKRAYRLKESFRLLLQRSCRYLNPLFHFTVLRATHIIAIDKHCIKAFPFCLVPYSRFSLATANGVELIRFERSKKDKERIRIVSVGRLIYRKAFNLVIESFAKLTRVDNQCELVIVGGGVEENYLRKLAMRLGIAGRISFTGFLERDAVLDLMRESDIFLFPSFEGGGMVVMEAMAMGLPVVCLDYGGPGEAVTEACGMKVKPITFQQTLSDLTAALLKLASDSRLRKRMGYAAKKRAEYEYNWSKKKQLIAETYGRFKVNQ